ncbi:YSIRK-type signal peptide-containing protein [Limosilactobacillus reuteri]|uniref:Rib/alpha-like domain-containing protein n=1 Tax=Limosilactobacillus reuteri TaxID=1598 RepID=UPI000DE928A2|nr:Rib/alpha-like domain-containing protein [Limosilactobacillus reuteri]AXX74244.1 YSIRK-type signal peptide-containing protein [Limosilactobacillus reuteri]
MLSKNNRKEQFRKQEPKKQRFAIKKLTVGVASVLIGFTFMGMNASADTTTGANKAGNQVVGESQNSTSVNQTDDSQVALPTPNSQGTKSAVSDASGQATKAAAAKNGDASVTTPASSSAAPVSTVSDQQTSNTASANEQNQASGNESKATVATRANKLRITDKATILATANPSQGQTLEVNDWNSFGAALINQNVGNIVLTNDITAGGDVANAIKDNYGELDVTAKDIARKVTIDGQGKYALNFGEKFLAFTNANQGDNNSAWDLTLKDLTVNGDGYQRTIYKGGYGTIYFGNVSTANGQKDTVTLDGVTANIKQGPFIAGASHAALDVGAYKSVINVVLKGDNTINNNGVNANNDQNVNYGSTIQTGNLTVESGTTTMNVGTYKTNNMANPGGNMIEADLGNVTINEGATLNLNARALDDSATTTDVKGIVTGQFSNGSVNVNGNLNANMGAGHSSAIITGDMTIGKSGNVTINTKQDNNGVASTPNGVTDYNGYHYAPISLAVGYAGSVSSHNSSLINEGSLTIIRDTTDANGTILTAAEPLIAYGSGGSNNDTYTFKVGDGASLDLQDNAAIPSGWTAKGLNNPKIPWLGLITMFGTSNEAVLDITNPYYLNFQRVGNDTVGNFIRLEGTVNGAYLNYKGVQVNSDKDKILGTATDLYNTPIAQWEQGNISDAPSYVWYLQNLMTTNNWGNYADAFTPGTSKPAAEQGTDKLINSDTNAVTLGKNQGGQSITSGVDLNNLSDKTVQMLYMNQLLNNFSWWQPQRLAMGTKLNQDQNIKDNIKYQPTVKEIDTNTQHKLADFTVKDGIENIQGPDGIIAGALDNDKTVDWTKTHWYDASTDGAEFNDQYKNFPLVQPKSVPTSSDGNFAVTGDTPAYQTATVVYADGSIDFVDIPFVVTNKTDAETYTPSYKPVNVEQGQTATVDPSFTTQDDKDATAPTGTTFTTGTDTPDWATIDPSTGTVTVKPGTDVTPGAYNVPVTVTYPDKSTDETTVPVIVTKAGQTVTWGDNGAVVTTVDTSKLNAHETTENSQVLSAAGVVTAEGYELTDGKISTTTTPITIDPSTVRWSTTPDTNVDTATAAGKEITTSVNVDFTNNDAAKNILGSKDGVVTTNPFTIDAKGAGSKNVTTPVNVDLGSDLTSEQFGQLVDNNIPTDEIASTTWATKPDANGQGGVIKITFTDKDANGNPTYLNINIPASSIKVTTDADKNTPTGQDVSTKVGEVPDAEKGIKNPGSLPSGTTYTWQDTPDTTKPGKKPAVVVVTYPDGSKDTVPTNVIVNAKPEIKTITTTVGGDPAATQGIANLNNGGTSPVDGYPSSATWTTKPDTSKPGATTGTATVTYPGGTTETVTIPVAVNGNGDVTIIDDKGHTFSLHANDVVTHKTSDKNIIGGPVIESFKLSYYQGGQSYSKPYIYTLNADKTAYVLTQTGDNPSGVTVNAPQSINASDIKISWTEANTVLFNNALGAIMGNGQPTSLDTAANNGGTGTIEYTNWKNNQFGYPKYSAVVDSSSVIWPIYGKGPVSTYPFPSVYIYGAEANGTIPNVNSDVTDLKAALGDASKLVNTSDLTVAHNAEISSVDWQTLPSLDKADAKAPATVRINFTDGSYLDVPVAVNVIKVDQGVDDKTNHDIYRDITRTINVEGESTPVVQHVIYSRAKITDLSKPADQQVTYTDWAAAKNSEGQVVTNFPQFEVTKPGYTAAATGATIETVDGKQYVPASGTITENSANEVVNVTYTANEHTLVIKYVDGNGNVVSTYNVPGKTDETVNVDVPGNVPTNWKLVPNQKVIGSYTFGSDDPQPVDYKVEHGTEVVPVDKNNKNTYRKITQTIQEVPAGKTNADMTLVRTASVEFERTGVKDLVTGETTWNAWNSNSKTFPAYNIKEQKGYDSYVNDVKATEVAAVTVNPDSSDITDTITYVKQDATPVPYDPTRDDMSVTRTINYEVPAGHEAIAPVTQTVEYTRDVNGVAGYQDPVTGKFTWNAWHVKSGKAEFASVSVEQIKGYDSYVDGTKSTEVAAAAVTEKDGVPQNGVNVTVSYQKQADTPVPYKPGQDGVNDDMNQYVTRTIVVHEPGKDPVSHDQTVHFTREDAQGNAGYTDPVTGEITWNAWHVAGELNQANGTWAEFNAPTVKGYTPSHAKVAAEEVTAETKNATVDITYNPVAPTGQNVTTKVGEVPDADQGIANKGDLPDGTKYSWKTTPDVTTDGNKPAVVVVTYPGGSTVEVPVTVTVTKNPTDADKYTPEGQDVNTKTGVVPDPAEGIKNKSDLPDGTKYTWKDTPDVTTAGDKPATVVVTYPDGSKDEVPVTIHVTNPATDADKYTPEGQDVNTKTGVVPDPAEGIKNKSDLPDGTKYTWKDTPDVSTEGNKPATVVVTYPDGSKDEVPVTIHVTNPATDADKYTPEGQDVNTKTGELPNPADGIKNKSDLPDGTKYTWKDTPDVSTEGNKPATVVVTYPDGSKDEVPVTIHVTNPATDADKYTPEGQDVNTKTGELPNPADGIKNKSDLPDGTKYTWKDTPDVSTEGNKPATIVVTYPDGSKDEVPVTIHVTNPATDADKYTPETQPITTPEGKVPDASDGIKNKTDLPNDTKYTWTDPDQVAQDVKKPGSHTETITVRYPDGSEDTVTVTVNVPAPEGQNITTDQGKLPNPADAIKNKDQMPDGTTYTWKQEPDVSTPGDHTGVVEVHFPDGTTYEVTVDVHVDAVTPDNGGNMNSGNGSIDHQNGTEINNGTATKTDNGSVIENVTENSVTNSTSQQPAKTLPQTGNDSSKFSALAGLSLAAFASLFGFAGHDKKRKADK